MNMHVHTDTYTRDEHTCTMTFDGRIYETCFCAVIETGSVLGVCVCVPHCPLSQCGGCECMHVCRYSVSSVCIVCSRVCLCVYMYECVPE